MPHADPEARRVYQRRYQREYARRRRAEKRAASGRAKFQRCEHPKFGLGRCEICEKAYQRDYRKSNRERIRQQCKEYRTRTVEQRRLANAEWRAKNVEWRKAYMAEYIRQNPQVILAAANRRRARKAGAVTIPFTVEQLAARWAYFGNRCWVCRSVATETDHVKPIAKGGAHMLCNLRPICRTCNAGKRDAWPYQGAA